MGILEFFPGAWLLVGLPWLGFLDGCIAGWNGRGEDGDDDDLFSFGKMEIGVSTCVVLPSYQRLSFFFCKNYGGTFWDASKGFIL